MLRCPSVCVSLRAVRCVTAVALVVPLLIALLPPLSRGANPPPSDPAYVEVVRKTARMVADPEAQRLAGARGLQFLCLTWEDTGRFKFSAVGPNISDMTIQVPLTDRSGETRLTCMPVLRFPNFSDRTGDIAPDQFFLLVGNEKGDGLKLVSLREYLGNVRRYLSSPRSWKGDRTSLLADRDTHVLVSAQACFLPVPKEGMAEFNPVLFNYQSQPGDPAVLAILATREGTSLTVIDNGRDRFGQGEAWGQQLYFNQKGERARFTGQRLSDFKEGPTTGQEGGRTTQGPGAGDRKGLNLVLLIQVPLKQKPKPRREGWDGDKDKGGVSYKDSAKDAVKEGPRRERSDVEEAVVGHGKPEGPFTEFADLDIERDPAYPVRVTVQFYQATSNGVVDEKDVKALSEAIGHVYDQADFVGSLVTDGRTRRPTEHDGPQVEPPDWWQKFWQRYQDRHHRDRREVLEELRKRHGSDWVPLTERELADEAETLDAVALGWPGDWGRNRWLAVAGVALAALAAVAVLLRRRLLRSA